jgi:hypothetical protein
MKAYQCPSIQIEPNRRHAELIQVAIIRVKWKIAAGFLYQLKLQKVLMMHQKYHMKQRHTQG